MVAEIKRAEIYQILYTDYQTRQTIKIGIHEVERDGGRALEAVLQNIEALSRGKKKSGHP